MRRRALIGVSVAVAALGAGGAVLAVAGGDPAERPAAGDRFLPGSKRAGAGGGLTQAPEASCEQWRAGSPRQREQALDDIEAVFSRGGRGAVLSRDEGRGAIERACALSFAGPWRLWKVYERALAFQYR